MHLKHALDSFHSVLLLTQRNYHRPGINSVREIQKISGPYLHKYEVGRSSPPIANDHHSKNSYITKFELHLYKVKHKPCQRPWYIRFRTIFLYCSEVRSVFLLCRCLLQNQQAATIFSLPELPPSL